MIYAKVVLFNNELRTAKKSELGVYLESNSFTIGVILVSLRDMPTYCRTLNLSLSIYIHSPKTDYVRFNLPKRDGSQIYLVSSSFIPFHKRNMPFHWALLSRVIDDRCVFFFYTLEILAQNCLMPPTELLRFSRTSYK